MLRFSILGPLEVVHDDRAFTPTAPRVRAVLGLLLLRANRLVSRDAILGWLWGEAPPRSAITTTQTYIYQLRRAFERAGITGSDDELIETRPQGYLLHVGPDRLDATAFTQLTERGRVLLEEGHTGAAAQLLRTAVGLWRGPVLADVPVHGPLEPDIAHLTELRTRALELRIEADLRLGHHRELIPELRTLVATHPLNEWFHARLIDVLHRAGRRGDALAAYEHVREVLNEELGLDPAPELRQLHLDVLNGYVLATAAAA